MKSLTRFENVDFIESKSPGQITPLAQKATIDGYTHIISVGGDGTLNEVLNGIMKGVTTSPPKKNDLQILKNTTIGCLPYGTANDFCKTLNLTKSIDCFDSLLSKNTSKPIDICKADFKDTNGQSTLRYFLNITDVGIGGLVARKLANSNKFFGSDLTYFKAITESFFAYRKTQVRCYNNHFEWQGKLLSLVMANGKYFGSGLCVAPDAQVDDGHFSVVILGDVSIFDYLLNMPKVKAGKKINHPQVSYHSLSELTVEALDTPCEIDMDGEFVGFTPVRFSLLSKAINFLSIE